MLIKVKVSSSIFRLLAVPLVLASSRYLAAQQVTVLANLRVIDGTGAPAQPNRTVVIRGDRIQSIVTTEAGTPSDVNAVDMHGQTIMPLIINTHGHLGMVKGSSSGAFNQTEENFRHQLLRYL